MSHKIYHFDSLSSTQDKAKELSEKGIKDVVVVADRQAKGRGRFRRKWHSSEEGLWMSILLELGNVESMQYLTFAAAVSVVRSIYDITGIETNIKWPNDVHYNGKKLCGILTEGVFGKKNHAVVGIGINVNHEGFPTSIKKEATSLKLIKGRKFNKERLLENILSEFFSFYNEYYNKNKLKKIREMWERYCDTLGKDIMVQTRNGKFIGKAVGIDEDCSLLVRLKDGSVKKVVEGDVTVRYAA